MNYEYTSSHTITSHSVKHRSVNLLNSYDNMTWICENIFNFRSQLQCLVFMKSGEIITNPEWKQFNHRILENTLINSLGELEDVRLLNVRSIMNDYDGNMLISDQIMNRIKNVGFNSIEIEFKGIIINLYPGLQYVVATTLIELVGENANSIYNALELIK